MEKKRIPLKFPIELPKEGGGKVEAASVTLITRIKVKHLKLFPKVEKDAKGKDKPIAVESMIPLIAALLEIPVDAVGEIDLDDLTTISSEVEKIMGELGSSPLTTGTN
jgi:hypothetical protein